MGHLLLLLAVALVAAALVFGVTVLIMGGDQGMEPAEPDGRAVPLPGVRPLTESDLSVVRFDVALRGYRMAQVDQALRRAAYDIGYKEELIGVLEAEVEALREGRVDEADRLRQARMRAAGTVTGGDAPLPAAGDTEAVEDRDLSTPVPAGTGTGDGTPAGNGAAPATVDGAHLPAAGPGPQIGQVPQVGTGDGDAVDDGADRDAADRAHPAAVESAK